MFYFRVSLVNLIKSNKKICYKKQNKTLTQKKSSKKKFFLNKGWCIIRNKKGNLGKVKNSLKKEFDSEPVYNEKYLKAKIKSYNDKINTNFPDNKIPGKDSQFICLSVMLTDSVFRADEIYYHQVLLEDCIYVVEEKRFINI